MIKHCVVIALVFLSVIAEPERKVATFPEEARTRINAVVVQCAGNESKAKELMTIVREGKHIEDKQFKDFVHCGFQKSGYAFDDGRVNIELAAPLYPDPPAVLKVMKQCDEKRGPSPVDTTFEFFKCFQENTPYRIGL